MGSFRLEAIGCPWQIDTEHPLSIETQRSIRRVIDDYDRVWSRFRVDSTVATLADPDAYERNLQQVVRIDLPPESAHLSWLYESLYRLTGGAVSPLVGSALEHWGYDADYSLRAKEGEPRADPWGENFTWSGTSMASARPVTVDVGAAGKGQLAGLVGDVLGEAGHTAFAVDASGDLVNRGASLRVGLEHPFAKNTAIGIVELGDAALAASATNRRAWGEGLHHVIDARTGHPVQEVAATWVIADDPATADGLATALFFVEAGELMPGFEFDYVQMFTDGRVRYSESLPGEVFTHA